MNSKNTLQQKIVKFLNDNYGWILVIVGITVLIFLTDLDNVITDFARGYIDGFSNRPLS